VQPGDSLWKIAAKPEVLGDGSRWKEIQELNRLEGTVIHPGLVLQLPEK